MINIEELEEKFSIEGELGFAEAENDLVFITVSNKFADADICLYGAHITSFRPHRTMDILWMSPESNFEPGLPKRGGIPICFPWFGPHKTDADKPQHGFARLMNWNVVETKAQPSGETILRLQLCSSEKTKAFWAHEFCAELEITVGKTLTVTLNVSNTSSESFEYSCALHSYFNLSAIGNLAIEGLHNTKYHNQLAPGDFVQEEKMLKIQKAETRHYYDTESTCVIYDEVFGRKIVVEKKGSKVTTVWNPWEETCSKIDDMPDDAYQTFVCLETVNAFEDTIQLAAGESHETTAIIGLQE